MNWGLKGRSIALCMLLLLGTVAVLSTALIWLDYRDSMRTVRQHASVHAHSVTYFAEPDVLLNDPEALERVAAAALQGDAACEVQIIDAKGNVLASARRDPHFEPESSVDPRRPMTGEPRHGSVSIRQTASQLAVVVPIWPCTREIDLDLLDEEADHPAHAETAIGYVALTYTLDGIRAEFINRVLSVVFVAFVVVAAGIAATIIAVRQLLRPLKNLVATTDAIARGDRSKRATERAVGEFGELARSFNFMADRLQESHSSIERQVVERTAELRAREDDIESEIAERRRAQERIERLNHLNENLLGPGRLAEKLQRITNGVVETLDADFARIWITIPGDLCDSGCIHASVTEGAHVCRLRDRCLHLIASSGRYTHTDGEVHRRVPFGCCKIGRVAASNEPKLVTNDVTHDPRVHNHEWARQLGLVSFAGYRLRSATGESVGVLALFCKHEISGEQDALLEGLASTTSQVIQRAWAQEELREHAELLRAKNVELETQQQQFKAQQHELLAANQALEEARLAAEASSQAKSDSLANMSHEIRTPMTAILGFSENLLDRELSQSDGLNAINTIRRNGEHLLNIVNDILDISKIEAGKLELERLSCSPVAVVGEAESLMRPRAVDKGLSFDVEFLTDIPESIKTDPTRLRQILINLMGNAVKFTETGGVKLRVQLLKEGEEARASSPKLRFDVVDTGIGMTPDQLAQVFSSFTQADETMSRRFGGTGLGLAISRRLAAMLGGEITVESEPNKGSTFSLTIATGALEDVRLIDPRTLSTAKKPERAPDDTSANSTGTLTCRLLLVEDGPDNQRLISYVLRRAGAEVVVAEDGQVGADAAMAAWKQQQPFDVILIDMQMPVLDGYAATSLLRRKGYRHPIVALTAHAMSTDREACLNAGCDDYVTKPIDRQKLLQLLERYTRQSRDGLSATGASATPLESGAEESASG